MLNEVSKWHHQFASLLECFTSARHPRHPCVVQRKAPNNITMHVYAWHSRYADVIESPGRTSSPHKTSEQPVLSVAQASTRLHNGFVTAKRLRATSDRLGSGQKRAKPRPRKMKLPPLQNLCFTFALVCLSISCCRVACPPYVLTSLHALLSANLDRIVGSSLSDIFTMHPYALQSCPVPPYFGGIKLSLSRQSRLIFRIELQILSAAQIRTSLHQPAAPDQRQTLRVRNIIQLFSVV